MEEISESTIQVSFFEAMAFFSDTIPELQWAFHVPNGGHRLASVGRAMKQQGVKRGVPDIVFPVAANGCRGMIIELKAGRNKTTKEQDEWIAHFASQGWHTVVARSWTDAFAEVLRYLGRNPVDFGL